MGDITIIIDENISRLDANCLRVIMAGVELNSEEYNDIEDVTDSLRDNFQESGKFHFASLSFPNREEILKQIESLPIRAKILCFYYHNTPESIAKTSSIKHLIKQYCHDYNRRHIRFMIENASEYSKIVKKDLLFDGPTNTLSILPDAICHSYMKHISQCSNIANSESDPYERYLNDVVRTQIIDSFPERIFLSRGNKI